jgi:hypothetical protein
MSRNICVTKTRTNLFPVRHLHLTVPRLFRRVGLANDTVVRGNEASDITINFKRNTVK